MLSWSQLRALTIAPPSLPPEAVSQNAWSSQVSFTLEAGAQASAAPRGKPLSNYEKLIFAQIYVNLGEQYGEGQTKFFTTVVGQLSA